MICMLVRSTANLFLKKIFLKRKEKLEVNRIFFKFSIENAETSWHLWDFFSGTFVFSKN